jgi:hypothetical protein
MPSLSLSLCSWSVHWYLGILWISTSWTWHWTLLTQMITLLYILYFIEVNDSNNYNSACFGASTVTRLLAGQPRNRNLVPGMGRDFFSSQHPDHLWGLHSLRSNGYRELILKGWSSWGVQLITHLHSVARLRICGVYLVPHKSSWWDA